MRPIPAGAGISRRSAVLPFISALGRTFCQSRVLTGRLVAGRSHLHLIMHHQLARPPGQCSCGMHKSGGDVGSTEKVTQQSRHVPWPLKEGSGANTEQSEPEDVESKHAGDEGARNLPPSTLGWKGKLGAQHHTAVSRQRRPQTDPPLALGVVSLPTVHHDSLAYPSKLLGGGWLALLRGPHPRAATCRYRLLRARDCQR